MQIKMTEYLQGTGISAILVKTGQTVTVLEPGGVYEVGSDLATYILDNHKGLEVRESVHYGGQPEPEFRHDNEKYVEQIMTTKNQATSEEIEIAEVDDPTSTLRETKRRKRGKP